MTYRSLCSSTKTLEIVLLIFTYWVGAMTFITPYILKNDPPAIYRFILRSTPDWQIGMSVLVVAVLHTLALASSPCCGGERRHDVWVPLNVSQRVSMTIRTAMSYMQVFLWVFLTVIYIMIWRKGEASLGVGMAAIVTGIACVASYCLSKERAKTDVKDNLAS